MATASKHKAPEWIRHVLAVAVLVSLAQGCRWSEGFTWIPSMRPPEIPDESTVEQIVQVLNINTLGTQTQQGLKSWNATSASVTMPGMVPVPATIAVEAPRNLRIRIAHPITKSELADLGSNPEEFWLWARDSDPRGVVHVKHEEVELVSRHLDLPIDPDWMMEVFGVVPIDASEYTRHASGAGAKYVDLVGNKTAPNGALVVNVIRVDLSRGVIVSRSLHAEDGTVLGLAKFDNHVRDSQSQLMLPREITLEIPSMGSAVTFHLKNVQLNPPPMQARIWQPPRIPGEPDIQLVDYLPPEALQASPLDIAGHQQEGLISLPDYTDDEGLARTRDVDPVSGTGGRLRPSAWGSDPADMSIGDNSDSDPFSRWHDIGASDGSESATGIMSLDFEPDPTGGDAPPFEGGPAEPVREFEPTPEPAFDARPAWAQ